MHMFRTLFFVGVLAIATGCRSKDSNVSIFHSGGWEDAKDAKSHLDAYKQVLVACIYEDHWEDRGPHRLSLHHYKATVVRTFKGDWHVSERVALVHGVDAPALTTSNADAGRLVFVFLNEHTDAEISLDTGDFGAYSADVEHALQIVYPQRSSR